MSTEKTNINNNGLIKTGETSMAEELPVPIQNDQPVSNRSSPKKNKKVQFDTKVDEVQIQSYKKFNRSNTSSKSLYKEKTCHCECILF